jgi:malonyl-CoA/methylmalonyl-CoA synthetase
MTNHLGDALLTRHGQSDKPFLRLPDRDPVSCAEFIGLTGRLANTLVARGVRPGDRVVAPLRKSVEALALYGASLRAGVTLIPASPAYGADQLAAIAQQCGAGLVISDGDLAGEAARHDSRFADVDRSADDLAIVMLTSGTTGSPKACMLTHGNLLSNALILADAWAITTSDVVFHALPIYHTHGLLISTNAALVTGASMWFLPGFSVPDVLPQLARSTVVMGTPKFYDDLLASDAFTEAVASGVRLFVSGGASLNATTLDAFEARTGHRILERHGMTEANVSASNPLQGERRTGSVGRALPGIAIRIADPATGRERPAGSVGSVEIKGPNIFRGYLNDEPKTKTVFRADGYFVTGDIGRVHPDGYLEILARNEDLVLCGGERIDPREIEQAIDRLPGILESAIIGVPHPPAGEALLAIVVKRREAVVSEGAILRALQCLDPGKVPAAVRFVGELPRTPTGKIQKRHLREVFAGISRSSEPAVTKSSA